jgi:hypothetical protein
MKVSIFAGAAILVSGLAPAGLPMAATSALAQTAADCRLNERQAEAGWTCRSETIVVRQESRLIGGGRNCQDRTVSRTVFQAYNPAGNPARPPVESGPETTSPWGPAYPSSDGTCNHALV